MKDPTIALEKSVLKALESLWYNNESIPVYDTVTAKTKKPYFYVISSNTQKGFSESKDSFSRQVFLSGQVVTEEEADSGNATDCLQIANNIQELLKPNKKSVLDLGSDFKMITLIFSNTPHTKRMVDNGIQFRKTITIQAEIQQVN